MNWDMIGALGEVFGAVAVVGTLFYLAHQVRAASLEARSNRWSELHTEFSRVAQSWAENSTLSDIVFRGFTDIESLKPNEVFRLYSNLYPWFRAWEALYEYHGRGGLVDWAAEGTTVTMSDALGWPGMQKYWQDRRHWYSPGFRTEVDRLLRDAKPVLTEAYGGSHDAGT